jgi:8-oxo-dGTP pyrophosphatase MutT (NUDIX family)
MTEPAPEVPLTASCVSGVVLLRYSGAALLQLRDEIQGIQDPGMWVFPGGHVEPDETLETAARREFLEETCYDCPDLHQIVVYKGLEIGYPGEYQVAFFWSLFDEKQPIRCCEGQELRFVLRSGLEGLHTPAYLPRVWDLALEASGIAQPPSQRAQW